MCGALCFLHHPEAQVQGIGILLGDCQRIGQLQLQRKVVGCGGERGPAFGNAPPFRGRGSQVQLGFDVLRLRLQKAAFFQFADKDFKIFFNFSLFSDDIFVSGSLKFSSIIPIMLSAVLTGIGLDSRKFAFIRSRSL